MGKVVRRKNLDVRIGISGGGGETDMRNVSTNSSSKEDEEDEEEEEEDEGHWFKEAGELLDVGQDNEEELLIPPPPPPPPSSSPVSLRGPRRWGSSCFGIACGVSEWRGTGISLFFLIKV